MSEARVGALPHRREPALRGWNKRTGLAAALTFLRLNGISIVDPTGRLYGAMIAFATHELDKPGLAKPLSELAE